MFSLFLLAASLSAEPTKFDWPQWRGPNRDGVSKETGLLKKWPEGGPKVAWSITGLGGGYSTPSVADGVVFGMGYSTKEEIVWAVSEVDGKELWKTPIGPGGKVGYGEGPRSTPTVDGAYLYCVGVTGDLVCLNVADGKPVWMKNYGKDFGGKMMSGWGFSESPLVDGDKLLCTPGSEKAAIVALDKKTGKTLWQAEIPKAGGAGYSSIMKTKVGTTEMYITLLGKSGGVVGVDAATGKLLWQYTKIVNGTANIPTVIVDGAMVFASTGYGDGGTAVFEIVEAEGKFTAKEIVYYNAKTLQNHHGGMVRIGDYVYLGRAHGNGFPTCVEFKTGKILWQEDRGPGTGSAALSAADGMLYFRYQNGLMALVEANPKEYKLVSSFKLPEAGGKPSWPHPVIANGKLFIRDQDKLTVYAIKATQ